MPGVARSVGFLAQFVRHPLSVGAIAASSRGLGDRMAELVDVPDQRVVVELGPGTGAITRSILNALPEGGVYLGVERNQWMAARFREAYPDAMLAEGDARDLPEHLLAAGLESDSAVDAIICGLPWSVLPEVEQQRLVDTVVSTLRPGGHFASFAYLHGRPIPGARRFRRILNDRFATGTSDDVIWRNLPPAFVYHCRTRSTPR